MLGTRSGVQGSIVGSSAAGCADTISTVREHIFVQRVIVRANAKLRGGMMNALTSIASTTTVHRGPRFARGMAQEFC